MGLRRWPGDGTNGVGDDHGNRGRQLRRRGAGRDRHRDQHRHQRALHGCHDRRRHIRHHERADRRLCHQGRAAGIQDHPVEHQRLGGTDRARGLQARNRHRRGERRRGRDRRRAADRECRRRQQDGAGSGGEAAHPGPQSRDGGALHRRRHDAEPELVQQPEEHRRRPALRERPARAGQQLLDRRRGHERRHRQPGGVSAEPGRARADQRRDQQLLARARERRRRAGQHGVQVGHQPVLRATASTTGATTSWPRRRGRPTAPAAGSRISTARSSAARSAGRS